VHRSSHVEPSKNGRGIGACAAVVPCRCLGWGSIQGGKGAVYLVPWTVQGG
jgi:hypothetical protein